MSTTIKNIGGLRMEVNSPKQKIFTDVTKNHGGLGEYASPVALMCQALACCAVTTACMAARKMNVVSDGFYAEITGFEFDNEADKVSKVSLRLHLAGSIAPDMRKRLESYTLHGCTVGNTLKAEKDFTFIYDL